MTTEDQDAVDRVAAYMAALDTATGPDGEIIAGPPTHDAPYLSGSDLRAMLRQLRQAEERREKAVAIIARVTARMTEYDQPGNTGVNPRQVLNLLSATWPDGNYSDDRRDGSDAS